MDRAIIYTTDPAQYYPATRPKIQSEAQKKADRLVQTPIASVSDISALRECVFRLQHRQDDEGNPRNLDSFGGAVKSALIAENVPLVVKGIKLFVFLSYTAVMEKRLTKSRSMKRKSRDDKEKQKKTLKRSIVERGMSLEKDADAIEGIYESVADLDTAIGGYDKTIGSLDTAMGRLDKAMMDALTENQGTETQERPPDCLKRRLKDYPKSLRTGALNLHRVIGCLVEKRWTPAQATLAVISRMCLHPQHG